MSSLVELLPEIRMGDGDQAARALGEALPLEFGRTKLRGDHIHISKMWMKSFAR